MTERSIVKETDILKDPNLLESIRDMAYEEDIEGLSEKLLLLTIRKDPPLDVITYIETTIDSFDIFPKKWLDGRNRYNIFEGYLYLKDGLKFFRALKANNPVARSWREKIFNYLDDIKMHNINLRHPNDSEFHMYCGERIHITSLDNLNIYFWGLKLHMKFGGINRLECRYVLQKHQRYPRDYSVFISRGGDVSSPRMPVISDKDLGQVELFMREHLKHLTHQG